MPLYQCEVCEKLIPEADGITTKSGLWVCDSDTCRTLDDENQANEKVRPALACQTDHKRNISISSISQLSALAIEMEPAEVIIRDPIGLDSFPLGTVRSFKLYLKAQLIFLNAGIILP